MQIYHFDHLAQGSLTKERMTSCFFQIRIVNFRDPHNHFFPYGFESLEQFLRPKFLRLLLLSGIVAINYKFIGYANTALTNTLE